MQTAKNLGEYRGELREALSDDFLRKAMDNFAVAYRVSREKAFAGMDIQAVVQAIAQTKDNAVARMDELYAQFKQKAEAAGATVHLAKTAGEANEIVASIARKSGVKRVLKSKSMTAEETHLNHHLEAAGFEVTETDLGEFIIQLRGEGPTHMVMPAIHLSRYEVADLFADVTKQKQDSEIEKLVKVARRELRAKFNQAEMGVSGANFAISETGTLAVLTNEGNARLTATLPRVHVFMAGLDKLTPTIEDALTAIKGLPRNATGQAITSYVSWITGPAQCATGPDGKKELHIVFLDNGRSAIAKDPLFSQALRCVRCGACANVCPVYRMVGGHKYGHVYIGAIGLILTYFYHGRDKAKNLVQNCINCGACKAVCIAGIDLPRLIKEVYARIQDEEGHSLPNAMLGRVLQNRSLFHGLLRAAKLVQRPITGGTPYLRHLPQFFARDHGFRALPAIAEKPFRDLWPSLKPKVGAPKATVALFAGCVQDFVYPEQAAAMVKVLAAGGAAVEFPMNQSCCGLPVEMMGEKKAARDVAVQNIKALDPATFDYIVCGCASCASHLKKAYPRLLADDPGMALTAQRFADKVIDFSSFVRDVLGMGEEAFKNDAVKTAYHSPCHLCRGLGVTKQPRELLAMAGEYVQAQEEDVCCGFGGTYSSKFPEVSAEILAKKLSHVDASGAARLVTDCPGCVMQLRGGMEKRGAATAVRHIAEMLADNLKG
jgi:iron-sulfur cluster protein